MTGVEVMALVLALVGMSWYHKGVALYYQYIGFAMQVTAVALVAVELALQ